MKWYQSAARWGLMIGVALVGIGYLASGLSGNARDEQADQKLDLSPYKDPDILAVVEDVNAEFHKAWQRDQVEMAKPADWQTIARRVSLAALGSGVSLEDMRWMESLPEESRSEALVERLLGDRRFADYWGERLARSYVGADEGPFLIFRRRRFVNWLSGELHQNRPYGEIVRSLITARGIWTENPAVNFLTVTTDSGEEGRADPIRLAARTSRAFLGMRIDCLQCHDDFLGNVTLGTETEPAEGTQHDFHQLAAFYSSVANSIQGIKDDVHPYEYQVLYEDEKELVKPAVPYQSELLEGVPESGDEFRKQLADWVTHKENMPAARAAVNRVWALVFGKPLSEPVDDIPLHGPFPPGLDRLAHDFSEHNWDLRRLIRVIVSLDAFRVESRSDEFEVTKRHENAWAVFPLIRLRPEQVAACIVQACRLGTIDRESSFIAQIQAFGDMSDFVKRYGDTGEDEFDQDAITITQRLLAMNGKLMRERTEDSPISNAAGQIRMFAKDDRHAIETAYLAALNRSATEGEIDAWLSECEAAGERGKFLEDLYWALLNSSEFTWNH